MRKKTFQLSLLALLLALCAVAASAQSGPEPETSGLTGVNRDAPTKRDEMEDVRVELNEQRRLLKEQQQEIERLRADLINQSRIISGLLEQKQAVRREESLGGPPAPGTVPAAEVVDAAATAGQTQQDRADLRLEQIERRLEQVTAQSSQTSESLARRLGSITFSGDLRFRYEATFRQLDSRPNSDNPAILGNELFPRHRARVRARFGMRGSIGRRIDWGLRLATGDFSDAISTNQTFTDFYNRKPFGLDQAYISYRPSRIPGLQLQAGKFETPWLRTEMTFDNDLQPEGVNETYSRDFKSSALKNITLVLWQLPFLERNAALVRDASGVVNVGESRNASRDLALYGGQLRARFDLSKVSTLTLSAADLHFSGTQFITPVQFFGSEVQLPVTVNIPAGGGFPAQTVTGVARIPRSQLVAGHGSLGLSTATNNAVNGDGRLSSGFNLLTSSRASSTGEASDTP